MLICFIDEFTSYCYNLNYAETTVKELIRYIKDFKYSIKQKQVNDLSQVKYVHMLEFTTKQPASPNTVKARVWALKKYFNFLHLHEHVKENISEGLNMPKIPKKETRFLTKEELKVVFGYLVRNLNQPNGLRDFMIISFMAILGLRKSTVVMLQVEDVDVINQRLFIAEKGAKNKRPVLIPSGLFAIIRENISKINLTKGPLFLSGKNKRLRADAVNKIVRKIKDFLLKQGHKFAKNLHPHIFRHSAAIELNDIAGFDITREMLGHRNAENTRKYIHLSPTAYGAYMKKHPYFLNQWLVLSKVERGLV